MKRETPIKVIHEESFCEIGEGTGVVIVEPSRGTRHEVGCDVSYTSRARFPTLKQRAAEAKRCSCLDFYPELKSLSEEERDKRREQKISRTQVPMPS